MKDVNEVLKQKESDLERVKKEVSALMTAVPLLADEKDEKSIKSLYPNEGHI